MSEREDKTLLGLGRGLADQYPLPKCPHLKKFRKILLHLFAPRLMDTKRDRNCIAKDSEIKCKQCKCLITPSSWHPHVILP